MQYEASTPEKYMTQLEDDWRKAKLEKVRKFILKAHPLMEEGVEYKMLSYALQGKNIFHLNAQRAYVSLYVGSIQKIDGAQDMLRDFDLGKGCIRIKKRVDVEEGGLGEFIAATVAVNLGGGDSDC